VFINKKLKIIITTIIIITVTILAYKLGLVNKLKDIKLMHQWFKSFGTIGYLVYIIIYILASVFMLPGSILTIVAGIVYGPILGSILALLGATCGAAMSFLIAKYFMKGTIMSMVGSNTLYERIDKGFKVNGSSFLILTRLVPVFPFNLQNYAYGLTSIKTSTYIFWTFICMMPGAFIYAYMAGEIAVKGISMDILIKFTIAGILLFFISLIPKGIARKRGINIK
jgi:uncharacterized membrane protein YdjX (TVP38/TMEM64 family)